MFRHSLGHSQALKENRSNIIYMFYRKTLWYPKCSQNVKHIYNLGSVFFEDLRMTQ